MGMTGGAAHLVEEAPNQLLGLRAAAGVGHFLYVLRQVVVVRDGVARIMGLEELGHLVAQGCLDQLHVEVDGALQDGVGCVLHSHVAEGVAYGLVRSLDDALGELASQFLPRLALVPEQLAHNEGVEGSGELAAAAAPHQLRHLVNVVGARDAAPALACLVDDLAGAAPRPHRLLELGQRVLHHGAQAPAASAVGHGAAEEGRVGVGAIDGGPNKAGEVVGHVDQVLALLEDVAPRRAQPLEPVGAVGHGTLHVGEQPGQLDEDVVLQHAAKAGPQRPHAKLRRLERRPTRRRRRTPLRPCRALPRSSPSWRSRGS